MFIVALLLLPIGLFAHGEGNSFESQTEKYFVDIGYDIPFEAGEETLMDFSLQALKNKKPDSFASFTNISIKIYSGSVVMFERSIQKPEFGKAFAIVEPSKHGNWLLGVDFSMNEIIIESETFDIFIINRTVEASSHIQYVFIFTGIIVSLIVVVLASKRWRFTKSYAKASAIHRASIH